MTITSDHDTAPLTCMDGPERCQGHVEWRESLTGTGVPTARCDRHWESRLDRAQQLRSAYPDTTVAPDWFDGADAGERWDDDY